MSITLFTPLIYFSFFGYNGIKVGVNYLQTKFGYFVALNSNLAKAAPSVLVMLAQML
jgi:hypothetical protein